MNPMISIFISESRGNLDQASEALLRLEEIPDDPEMINAIFRAVHTIKGSSGLLPIKPLTHVAHALEDILDDVRDGKFPITSDAVDLLLESIDIIGAWINDLESEGSLPNNAKTDSERLCEKFKILLSESAVSEQSNREESKKISHTDNEDYVPSDFIKLIPEDVRMELYRESYGKGLNLISVEYTPNERCFYSDLDPLLFVRHIEKLCWQKIDTREPLAALDELDAYRCLLRFYMLFNSDLETIRQRFSDQDANTVIIRALKITDLVFPVGRRHSSELFNDFVQDACDSISHGNWERLHQASIVARDMASDRLIQNSALRWLCEISHQPTPDINLIKRLLASISGTKISLNSINVDCQDGLAKKDTDRSDKTLTKKLDAGFNQAIEDILHDQMDLLKIPYEVDQIPGRLESVKTVIQRIFKKAELSQFLLRLDDATNESTEKSNLEPLYNLIAEAWVEWKFASSSQETIFSSDQIANSTQDNVLQPRADKSSGRDSTKKDDALAWQGREDDLGVKKSKIKILKVDQERVDELMDLVGELVVAKNSLPFLAKRAEDIFGVKEMSRDIKNQYSVINRIATELQNSVMQVRMVPMSHIFERFRRLVRDLSRKLDKKIRLVIEGEDTEADKNVIEDLADPLIHLVRNSIDHGIESPEIRSKSGKNIEGEIRLCASQNDGQVVIDIIDDGKGLDREKIKAKAYEKGILSEEKLNNLSDQEIFQMIFEPGFSTVEEISDLSGRGVGMNVVQTVVSEKRGSISINSKVNQGTHVKLSLPLSMAVSHVMMVEVCGEIFGIPIDNIVESVRIPKERIHKIKKRETLILRNRLLPLERLNNILDMNSTNGHSMSDEESVLVVSIDGNEFGLVVDQFHEGVDIIAKPLEGFMTSFKMYSNMALLGDGRVLLIINLKELEKCL